MIYVFTSEVLTQGADYEPQLLPETILVALDGLRDHDPLSTYIRDDPRLLTTLAGITVSDGRMSLRRVADRLFLDATFTASAPLSEVQRKELFEFVSGQFSDGGGDGWMQSIGIRLNIEIPLDVQWERIETRALKIVPGGAQQ
jgi:hypothetical protein